MNIVTSIKDESDEGKNEEEAIDVVVGMDGGIERMRGVLWGINEHLKILVNSCPRFWQNEERKECEVRDVACHWCGIRGGKACAEKDISLTEGGCVHVSKACWGVDRWSLWKPDVVMRARHVDLWIEGVGGAWGSKILIVQNNSLFVEEEAVPTRLLFKRDENSSYERILLWQKYYRGEAFGMVMQARHVDLWIGEAFGWSCEQGMWTYG